MRKLMVAMAMAGSMALAAGATAMAANDYDQNPNASCDGMAHGGFGAFGVGSPGVESFVDAAQAVGQPGIGAQTGPANRDAAAACNATR